MAYAENIYMVVGDTKPVLTVTLRDKNTAASGQTLDSNVPTTWAPIDVTGATVNLYIREVGQTAYTTRVMTLSDPSNGVVITDFVAANFPAAGVYEGEIEITFADSSIQTLQDFIKFTVRAGIN